MAPKVIRWGILATGNIARTFSKDLTVDPVTRGVYDIKHVVVAAASSSGKARAEAFLQDVNAPSTARAYGSHEEMVEDNSVDIIYIATPHSHHYQNALLCLEAGKNVLCEKAFTVNADQLKKLAGIARQKGLFLMEAIWTRYFPLSVYIRESITSGRIGNLIRVSADNAEGDKPERDLGDSHRLVNPALAGGVLLDMGIYSLTWVFQTAYSTQPSATRKAPKILSSLQKYPRTGVDELTTILLTFPRDTELGGDIHGIATAAFRTSNNIDRKGTAGPAVRIQGTEGEIQVWPPIFRPSKTRLFQEDGTVEEKIWSHPGPGAESGFKNGFMSDQAPLGEGYGMFWEADEAGLAISEGRNESRFHALDEAILIMETMDKVRKDNDLYFPMEIETTDKLELETRARV